MTHALQEYDFVLTKDTPYLALTGDLWGVCWDDFRENLPHYNGAAMFSHQMTAYQHARDPPGAPFIDVDITMTS